MNGAPASPEPDAKDWTWVLDRPCPDCGFVAASLAGPAVASALRDSAARWQAVLTAAASGADIRRRPAPAVWSTLEYGAHCALGRPRHWRR